MFYCFSFLKLQQDQGSTMWSHVCAPVGNGSEGISKAGIATAQWPVMQLAELGWSGTVKSQWNLQAHPRQELTMILRNRQPSHWGVYGKLRWSLWASPLENVPCDNCFWAPAETTCGTVQKQLVWERRWCFQLQNKRTQSLRICITEEEWRSGRPLGTCPGLPLSLPALCELLLSSLNPSNRPWCPFFTLHFSYIMLDWKAQVQFTQPLWVCWSFRWTSNVITYH